MVATYRSDLDAAAGVLVGVEGELLLPQAVTNRASPAAAHSATVFPVGLIGCRTCSQATPKHGTKMDRCRPLTGALFLSTANRDFWSCFSVKLTDGGENPERGWL